MNRLDMQSIRHIRKGEPYSLPDQDAVDLEEMRLAWDQMFPLRDPDEEIFMDDGLADEWEKQDILVNFHKRDMERDTN